MSNAVSVNCSSSLSSMESTYKGDGELNVNLNSLLLFFPDKHRSSHRWHQRVDTYPETSFMPSALNENQPWGLAQLVAASGRRCGSSAPPPAAGLSSTSQTGRTWCRTQTAYPAQIFVRFSVFNILLYSVTWTLKWILINLPNRDELSFLDVFAFPYDSSIGFVATIYKDFITTDTDRAPDPPKTLFWASSFQKLQP